MVDPALCARCRGARRLCGRPRCPILERIAATIELIERVGELGSQLEGASPPSVLVGEYGYPKVRVVVNVPPVHGEEAAFYERPDGWWGKLTLEDIIRLRCGLIGSKFLADVRRPSGGRLLETAQEVAMSEAPVEAEAEFEKPPKPRLVFDGIVEPIGPSGVVKRLVLTANPRVPRAVDRVVEDTDLKAEEAMAELYAHGIPVYQIARMLSLGLLGRERARRLVPTRWAITAVDSQLARHLLSRVRGLPEVGEIRVYTSEYIGNHYEILMIPGAWSFELIEVWLPRSIWVRGERPYIWVNYELHDGRPRVDESDGGYHAARLPVLEHLVKEGRQATVIVIREIRPDYYAPVGVWQVRESVRGALRAGFRRFDTIEEALKDIGGRLRTPIAEVISASILLRRLLRQESLLKYMMAPGRGPA